MNSDRSTEGPVTPLVMAESANPEQAALLARTPPINLFGLLANAPWLAGRVAALGASVMDGRLDPIARELVALRIGARLSADYVEGQHRRVAVRIAMPEDLIALATDPMAPLPEGPHGDVLCLADTVAAHGVLARDLAGRLEASYGREGLMGLAITAGYFAMLGALTRAFELPLEPPRQAPPPPDA